MSRATAIVCLLLALAALPALAVEFDATDWHEGADGFERAVEEAKRYKKPLLIYFRTDWCPYCKQFERELLAAQTVQQHSEEIVKVMINPEAGREENQIAAAYQVRGFPAIFMHPSDLSQPRPVRRTVMRDGQVGLQTPEEFVETLAQAGAN